MNHFVSHFCVLAFLLVLICAPVSFTCHGPNTMAPNAKKSQRTKTWIKKQMRKAEQNCNKKSKHRSNEKAKELKEA